MNENKAKNKHKKPAKWKQTTTHHDCYPEGRPLPVARGLQTWELLVNPVDALWPSPHHYGILYGTKNPYQDHKTSIKNVQRFNTGHYKKLGPNYSITQNFKSS